jgi:protoporphyrinogen oxidase
MLDVLIIGAGPAGLTAAYALSKAGKKLALLEADPRYVGGISRTVEYKGYRFDIGGHRFFSKSAEIEALWSEILGPDLLERPRLSRIYYHGKFFAYPLRPLEAFTKLGPWESLRCMASYAKAHFGAQVEARSFEDWVSQRFGKRLYEIFFRTYTEKVWGMPCSQISADWAAQRIKGLSLSTALTNALSSYLFEQKSGEESPKTLIRSFRYPRLGPGMMWERCAEKVQSLGGTLEQGWRVTELHWLPAEESWHATAVNESGHLRHWVAKHVISSMPMVQLGYAMRPALSSPALSAARRLRYRDFITVALILDDEHPIEDNWIFVHEPGVKVGRIQNFKSWSPELVPDPARTCYGMEYFCFEGDGMWNLPDSELIALAKREIAAIGLARPSAIRDAAVVRQPKAYPVYDEHYQSHVATLRREIQQHCPNLHLVGRNGMHKYNNQDHSMMTALLTVKNILAGKTLYDVWQVNEDAEYHEESKPAASSTSGLRAVPTRIGG